VPKGELWEAFEEYCRKFNVPLSFTKRTFGTRMRQTNTESSTTIDGKTVRVWLGIKLCNYGTHASHVSTIASEYSEKNKSVEENKEKRKMRELRKDVKLDEMFKNDMPL
jgi:hypothetical protein